MGRTELLSCSSYLDISLLKRVVSGIMIGEGGGDVLVSYSGLAMIVICYWMSFKGSCEMLSNEISRSVSESQQSPERNPRGACLALNPTYSALVCLRGVFLLSCSILALFTG